MVVGLSWGHDAPLLLSAQCQRVGAKLTLWRQRFRQVWQFRRRCFSAVRRRRCRPWFIRCHPEWVTALQPPFNEGVDRLLGRGDSVRGERLRDVLQRLTFAPRFEDEIEMRLQFALKRFAGHTHRPGDNPSTGIVRCK